MKNIIVIKIGSNAIIKSSGNIDQKVIDNLVKAILRLRQKGKQVLLVSSGAVAAAKKVLNIKENTTEMRQIKSAVGQSILMRTYRQAFQKVGVVVAQGLVTRADFASKERHASMKNILSKMLDLGILPIINENDFLTPEELDFSDNDQLAGFIAGMLSAERLILLSNVAGLFDCDPRLEGAKKIDEVWDLDEKIDSVVCESKSADGLGGMRSKIVTAKILSKLGIEMLLTSSHASDFLDSSLGTVFHPSANKSHSGTKVFLASGAEANGQLIVDDKLQDILQKKSGVSILSVGIRKVLGDFDKGEVIDINNIDGYNIGKGVAKISAKHMKEKLGNKGEICIHADFLFIF